MDEDKELLELGAQPLSDEDAELIALGASPYEVTGDDAAKMASYVSEPEKFDVLESLGLGAVEGTTLSFADEIGGAMGAAMEHPTQDLKSYLQGPMMETGPNQTYQGPKGLPELYEEYVSFNRDRFKQAHSDHPWASTVGNVAGGFALPIGSASKLANATRGQIMKEGFKTGSKLGTAIGAGASEAPINSSEFAVDTGIGLGLGGSLGYLAPPAIEGLVKGAAKTVDVSKNLAHRLVGPVGEAFNMGRAGQNIVTTSGLREAKKEIGQFAGSVAPEMQSELNRLAKLYDKILKQAHERGVKIDEDGITARIQSAMDQEPASAIPKVRAELEDLQELLRTYKEGRLVRKQVRTEVPSQKEAFRYVEELKRAEQEAIESGVNPDDIETVFENVDVPGKVAAVVRQKLYEKNPDTDELVETGYKKLASRLVNEEDIPGYKLHTEVGRQNPKDLTDIQVAEQLRLDLNEKGPYGGAPYATKEISQLAGQTARGVRDLQRQTVPQLQKVDQGIQAYKEAAEALGIKDTMNLNEAQIRDRLIGFINQEEKAGTQSIKVIEKLDPFIEAINKVNPRFAKELRDKISKMGSKIDAINSVNQDINLISMNSWLGIGRKFAPAATNLAGVGVGIAERGIKNAGQAVVNMTVSRSPEWMIQRAQQLAQRSEPAAKELSRVLIESASKEERARNAIIFGIMQNPAFRKLLDDEGEVK